ncbi:hypothetical protein GCM10027277_47170 [Pseudoduganella ginsengisoli]
MYGDSAGPFYYPLPRPGGGGKAIGGITGRAVGAQRAGVFGPVDRQINTMLGGRMVYWNVPEGHQWEMLTVSYARPQADSAPAAPPPR